MGTGVKTPNKTLANQIQERIKTTMHYDQVDIILGLQDSSSIHKSVNMICHINALKDRNQVTTSIEEQRQGSTCLHDRRARNRNGWSIPQNNKGNISQTRLRWGDPLSLFIIQYSA